MTPAQRREARISFAMLPVGVGLVLAAVVGTIAVLVLAIRVVTSPGDGWGWYAAWCVAAFAIGVRNLVGSLKAMSGLDVRGTLVTLGWSVAVVAAYPGWWLG